MDEYPASDVTITEIPDTGAEDPDHPLTQAVEAFKVRSLKAKKNAAAMRRASEGWAVIHTDTDWERVVERAADDYRNGSFLIAQLGGEGALDPPLMATLLTLRQAMIEELCITTVHESMMLDAALLSYRNFLRVQGWVENLAFLVEAECFGLDAPSAHCRNRQPFADKLTAEEHVVRLREGLMPLADQASRMFIRTLKALKETRHGPAPKSSVSVGVAGHVNVGRL